MSFRSPLSSRTSHRTFSSVQPFSRRRAARHLFEVLENRRLLSGTAALASSDDTPEVGQRIVLLSGLHVGEIDLGADEEIDRQHPQQQPVENASFHIRLNSS